MKIRCYFGQKILQKAMINATRCEVTRKLQTKK